MPRNGSGVASAVPGSNTVSAGNTILSALENALVNDLISMFNTAWPVSLGGTGGTTPITSWDAITAKGTTVPSAATLVLSTVTGPYIDISGTTSVTAVTLVDGTHRLARATGIFTLTASATLLVNKSASVNYTTAVGDLMIFTAEGGVVSVTVIGSGSSSSAATSNAPFTNFAIGTPSVAASALTIPFTGVDGNALSASNIAYINFRSATAGSGAIAQLALTALASLVISSGSTLGMTSGVAATLALAIFNDAGTARPAIINPLTLPLVDGIASATSEGGAGAADSAGVWYSNAAIASKAYTIVGYITATEATAGTWATAPSAVQVGSAPAVANQFSRISLGVSVASTSGTSIDFTGIGAAIAGGAKRVTINFTGVSTSGTSDYLVQIGDAGGIEASGYSGSGNFVTASTVGATGYAQGFGTVGGLASIVFSGTITLTLSDAANATWDAAGTLSRSDIAANHFTGGSKSLSPGPLDRVRITTVNGTDTFDAGKINITVE